MSAEKKRSGWVSLLLVLLPLWLIGSGAWALWYYFHLEKKQALVEQERFAQAVSAPLLADDLRKLVEVIGERNGSSEKAAANLSRTASMIEGLLGPTNTGFAIKRHKSTTQWPILQATITGKDAKAAAVWVVTSYDSRAGSRGAEGNATGLAATMAAAQAMAGDKPEPAIHFVFLPHANDPESPRVETAVKLAELVKPDAPPLALLYVEAMGAGDLLWISSRDAEAAPLRRIAGLGEVRGAEDICLTGDADFTSLLFEAGLPATRVSTRRVVAEAEPDDRLPFAPAVAGSAGRLIELIRRCAVPEIDVD